MFYYVNSIYSYVPGLLILLCPKKYLSVSILHLFFRRTRGSFLFKFKNKLRTIQPRQKNKVTNFQLK